MVILSLAAQDYHKQDLSLLETYVLKEHSGFKTGFIRLADPEVSFYQEHRTSRKTRLKHKAGIINI